MDKNKKLIEIYIYSFILFMILFIFGFNFVYDTNEAFRTKFVYRIIYFNGYGGFSKIVKMINKKVAFEEIVSRINALEFETGKTIKQLSLETSDEKNYQIIYKKLCDENGYQEKFSRYFEEENFDIGYRTIFRKDSYLVEFNDETLTVNNLTKNTTRKLDLSNFVQGVTTPERIQIYSFLQKTNGALLEYISDEVGGITSIKGSNFGGWFMSYGIAVLNDYNAIAHETGHAIDSHRDNGTWVNFSDELLNNKKYNNEILSMYKTGETDEYVRSLIGKYEYENIPASEREVYAECVRAILGFSNDTYLEFYKEFLPHTLEKVAKDMKYVLTLKDEQRGLAHEKQSLAVPKYGHIKAAKARFEKKDFNTLYVNNREIFN